MDRYESYLDKLGMLSSINGYIYWKEAIRYCMEDLINPTYNYEMMEIYKHLAIKYNTTASKAERNLRYIFQKDKDLNRKLKVDYRLNNSRFLALAIKSIEKGK